MKLLVAASLLALSLTSSVIAQEDDVDREAVAKRFFDAFCSGDMKTLDALYAKDVKWTDPITSFDDRNGVMGMWRWEASQHPKFSYELGELHGHVVTVTWHADYVLNGNPIHNDVTAYLTIDGNGQVTRHVDNYSWEKWAAQAFPGLPATAAWPYIDNLMRFVVAGTLQYQSIKANLEPEAPSKTKGFTGGLDDAEKK